MVAKINFFQYNNLVYGFFENFTESSEIFNSGVDLICEYF